MLASLWRRYGGQLAGEKKVVADKPRDRRENRCDPAADRR